MENVETYDANVRDAGVLFYAKVRQSYVWERVLLAVICTGRISHVYDREATGCGLYGEVQSLLWEKGVLAVGRYAGGGSHLSGNKSTVIPLPSRSCLCVRPHPFVCAPR